jgi:predicted ATP-grasp superfamily ATP-dependent carboligase
MHVLVTDGEQRSSLAVVRSLGKKGINLAVTGTQVRNLASCSRYCRKGYLVPKPLQAGAEYVLAIREIVIKTGVKVIFPMTDLSIHLLNPVRNSFPPEVILACAETDKMEAVSNKVSLFRLAEKLDIGIPRTIYIEGSADLQKRVGEIENFPVVVKPALSRTPEGQKFLIGGVRYAASKKELEYLYSNNPVLRYPSMIQEKIIGPGTGLFTLYDKNRHLALFSHRRLREKPPSGGVSVLSESVPLDEEMVEAAGRLLSAVKWTGVAMVEFKRDQRDGRAKLMEINGRFWGTLQLAIACGIDFPALLLDYLQEKTSTSFPVKDYREAYRLKWLLGTLDHLLIRLQNSQEELNLPPGSPSKLKALFDFLRIWEKNVSFDVFDLNDTGPFFFECRSYLHQLMSGKG